MPRKAEKVKEAELITAENMPLELMTPAERTEVVSSYLAKGVDLPIQSEVFASNLEIRDEVTDNEDPLSSDDREMKKKAFLEAFQSTGRIDLACKAAGITYKTFYYWNTHPTRHRVFQEQFRRAKDAVIAMYESRLSQLAMSNEGVKNKHAVSALMAILNAEAPEKYRPRSTVEHNVNIRDYRGM